MTAALLFVVGLCAGMAWMAVCAPDAIRELRTENALLVAEHAALKHECIGAVHYAAHCEELRVCAENDAARARDLLARELCRNGHPPILPPYTYPSASRRARTTT